MRFLQQTSPAQLRLGWLRIIATLVGTGRLPVDQLRTALAKNLDRCEGWLQQAGFSEPPRGTVAKSHVDRLARMGISYGIHAEATNALTDLGQVLRVVAPWTQDTTDNPLMWRDKARWIGLNIVVQAAGDALIPLLQNWSPDEQTIGEVSEKLAGVLNDLARLGRPEERALLRKQAEGASPKAKNFKARTTLYPYVEPLRDLGYVERSTLIGGGPSYRITEAGARLRSALRSFDGDTEALLRSGISRAFLMGEGHVVLQPAPGHLLAQTLATMPAELTVLRAEEVPLDPVVLIAQARALHDAPGTWIDLRLAHDLLKAVGQRGGKLEVKRGSSVRELNVAWEGPSVLANSELWDVTVDTHNPFTKTLITAPETVIETIKTPEPTTSAAFMSSAEAAGAPENDSAENISLVDKAPEQEQDPDEHATQHTRREEEEEQG
jgi:hypothetical protein